MKRQECLQPARPLQLPFFFFFFFFYDDLIPG